VRALLLALLTYGDSWDAAAAAGKQLSFPTLFSKALLQGNPCRVFSALRWTPDS
jgi:hypothetical protein